MKKAILPIFVLAMLLALVGAASASPPQLDTFSITGYATIHEYETLPSGLTKFHITARGGGEDPGDTTPCGPDGMYGVSCYALCSPPLNERCGADGHFRGDFAFEEWVRCRWTLQRRLRLRRMGHR
jgi:hypothetical protein